MFSIYTKRECAHPELLWIFYVAKLSGAWIISIIPNEVLQPRGTDVYYRCIMPGSFTIAAFSKAVFYQEMSECWSHNSELPHGMQTLQFHSQQRLRVNAEVAQTKDIVWVQILQLDCSERIRLNCEVAKTPGIMDGESP
jgi:hypothetical protein